MAELKCIHLPEVINEVYFKNSLQDAMYQAIRSIHEKPNPELNAFAHLGQL